MFLDCSGCYCLGMMLSAAPNPVAHLVARSSLEVMLDTLRQRDEQPKDLPPALPARPTSRGRLPSSRRSLPIGLKLDMSSSPKMFLVESTKKEESIGEQSPKKGKEVVFRSGIFGNKRICKVDEGEESPYAKKMETEKCEERVEEENSEEPPAVPSPLEVPIEGKLGSADTIDSVLKKVMGFSAPSSISSWVCFISKMVFC